MSSPTSGWCAAAGHLEIPLTCGQVTIIDAADWPLVQGYKWRAAPINKKGVGWGWYAVTSAPRASGGQTTVRLHRLLMPDVARIDHKNGDGLYNCRSNLRPANRQQNMANSAKRRTATSSRYKGVHWRKNRQRWKATIIHSGRHIGLRSFRCEEDAARAYNEAATRLFGEFARLNDIPA